MAILLYFFFNSQKKVSLIQNNEADRRCFLPKGRAYYFIFFCTPRKWCACWVKAYGRQRYYSSLTSIFFGIENRSTTTHCTAWRGIKACGFHASFLKPIQSTKLPTLQQTSTSACIELFLPRRRWTMRYTVKFPCCISSALNFASPSRAE